jgi:hypothetical protein
MSTRSTISIVQKNGKVKSIYCRWDGYVSHNGKILFEHYNTEDKVKELVSLGALNSLRDNIKPTNNEPHSFDSPQENVVVAYYRDRGEDLMKHEFDSIESFYKNGDFQEYNYIFKDGKWSYFKNDEFDKFKKLTKILINKSK